MALCNHCGAEINENAAVCMKCGFAQNTQNNISDPNADVNDSGSFGWAVLGFLVPIVGLVLFLTWKNTKPKCAKKAGIGALVSVIIGVLFNVLAIIIGGIAASSVSTYAASFLLGCFK